jgi:SAM-dependent methyltransferase
MSTEADPRALAQQQFGTAEGHAEILDVIERFATDPPIVIAGLLDAIRPAAALSARICELGFGTGWLLGEIVAAFPDAQAHGLDLSPAMAGLAHDAANGRARVVLGDMERLPYWDAAFDAIITCWTLYFMRDIDAALSEANRCLKPGGVFVAATVAADNMLEYEEMAAAAVRRALGREPGVDVSARFNLDSGAALVCRHFPDAELREWHGEMAIPDIESMMQLWSRYGPFELPPDENAAAAEAFRALAAEHLERDGIVRIRRHSGAFVATRV